MLRKTGIGLRAPHVDEVLQTRPDAGFLEVHAENYFSIGGAPFLQLAACREVYPVSLHGVGLSLGSADGVSRDHLQKLAALAKEIDPVFVSDHISWSGIDGEFVPDLLPLPLTVEALDVICANIQAVQDALKRRILVENPSVYEATGGDIPETEFIADIIRRTGCGLLLDVNNIEVSAHNLGFDAQEYLAALPDGIVGEVHLAGYEDKGGIFIDAHNHPVREPVWALYEQALLKYGDVPTLVEWDSDIPALSVLLAEAARADAVRKKVSHVKAA